MPAHPAQLDLEEVPWEPPDPAALRIEVPGAGAVYVVHDPLVPLVRLSLALPVGDRDDPPGQPGVASMTVAMMRRGGTEQRTPEDFENAVERLGARLEAHGGESRTVFTLVCLQDVFPEALDLLFEMWREARFDAPRLERAKEALRTGFAARGDDPRAVLRRRWNQLLLGADHPRSRQLAVADLDQIDRDALLRFHHGKLLPQPPWIAVSGAAAPGLVAELLEPRLAGLGGPREEPAEQGSGGVATALPEPPSEVARSAPPGFYQIEHPAPQGKMMLGHRGLELPGWDDPRWAASLVLQEILDGAGTLSRLRSRLRGAESLVYTVQGVLEAGAEDPVVEVFLEVDPGSALRAAEAVVEELERLRREPVGAAEIDFARRGLVQRFPFYFSDPEAIAGRFALDDLVHRPHSYWSSYRERIASVTSRQVRALAQEMLAPERLCVLWVGPALPAAEVEAWMEKMSLAGAHQRLPRLDPLTLQPRGAGTGGR